MWPVKTRPPGSWKISSRSILPPVLAYPSREPKRNPKYAIGNLTTAKGNFRVNIFFMSKDDKRLVYYMSIEKESQYELYPGP